MAKTKVAGIHIHHIFNTNLIRCNGLRFLWFHPFRHIGLGTAGSEPATKLWPSISLARVVGGTALASSILAEGVLLLLLLAVLLVCIIIATAHVASAHATAHAATSHIVVAHLPHTIVATRKLLEPILLVLIHSKCAPRIIASLILILSRTILTRTILIIEIMNCLELTIELTSSTFHLSSLHDLVELGIYIVALGVAALVSKWIHVVLLGLGICTTHKVHAQ